MAAVGEVPRAVLREQRPLSCTYGMIPVVVVLTRRHTLHEAASGRGKKVRLSSRRDSGCQESDPAIGRREHGNWSRGVNLRYNSLFCGGHTILLPADGPISQPPPMR